MVTVANCFTIYDAQRLQIALQANGIESFVPDEISAGLAPHFFTNKPGVRLQVADEDAERAEQVIAEARAAQEEEGEGGGDESPDAAAP